MVKACLVALFFLSSLSLHAGTESSGGGGVVWYKGRPILMDLFMMERDPQWSGPSEKNAFEEANSILKKWSELQFDVMSYKVSLAMRALSWSFVDHELEAPPFHPSSFIPEDSKIEVAAFYQFKRDLVTEILLQHSIWNLMDLKSQTGLILHETLRQVQKGWKHDFDDEALQRSTAIYLNCQPSVRLNYYLFYVLNNSPEMADRIYGTFLSFVEKECKRP